MEYIDLTPEQQIEILTQRRQRYEIEHFQHQLNKDLLVASGATDKDTLDAIKAADAAMAVLDKAHKETEDKIAIAVSKKTS